MAAAQPESRTPPSPTPAPPPGGPPAASPPGPPREARVQDRGSSWHDAVRADRWTAAGTVKITNDVDVGTADLAGTISIGGRLRADRIRSRGTLEVEGPVEVHGLLELRGNCHFARAVRAVDLRFEGSVRCAETLSVDRTLTALGSLHAPSVAAGVLTLEGSLDVPGEIRSLRVDAELRRSSELGTIRATEVRLRCRRPNLVDKVFFHDPEFHVQRVEADRVELEGVDVAFVRAKEIALGRACHVTAYEGTIVRRHPTSSVGPVSKSPPPYGLRR